MSEHTQKHSDQGKTTNTLLGVNMYKETEKNRRLFCSFCRLISASRARLHSTAQVIIQNKRSCILIYINKLILTAFTQSLSGD